jgi:hypothetical protein
MPTCWLITLCIAADPVSAVGAPMRTLAKVEGQLWLHVESMQHAEQAITASYSVRLRTPVTFAASVPLVMAQRNHSTVGRV